MFKASQINTSLRLTEFSWDTPDLLDLKPLQSVILMSQYIRIVLMLTVTCSFRISNATVIMHCSYRIGNATAIVHYFLHFLITSLFWFPVSLAVYLVRCCALASVRSLYFLLPWDTGSQDYTDLMWKWLTWTDGNIVTRRNMQKLLKYILDTFWSLQSFEGMIKMLVEHVENKLPRLHHDCICHLTP